MEYSHTLTNTDHGDEGFVQLHEVETSSLQDVKTIFITVWAVNTVSCICFLQHLVGNYSCTYCSTIYLFRAIVVMTVW